MVNAAWLRRVVTAIAWWSERKDPMERTVRRWQRRFQQGGVETLAGAPIPGWQPRPDVTHLAALVQAVETPPGTRAFRSMSGLPPPQRLSRPAVRNPYRPGLAWDLDGTPHRNAPIKRSSDESPPLGAIDEFANRIRANHHDGPHACCAHLRDRAPRDREEHTCSVNESTREAASSHPSSQLFQHAGTF